MKATAKPTAHVLHPKVTDPAVRQRIKDAMFDRLQPYAWSRLSDHFATIVVPDVIDHLMDVVKELSDEELQWNDLWESSWDPRAGSRRGIKFNHAGIAALAREISDEMYRDWIRKFLE